MGVKRLSYNDVIESPAAMENFIQTLLKNEAEAKKRYIQPRLLAENLILLCPDRIKNFVPTPAYKNAFSKTYSVWEEIDSFILHLFHNSDHKYKIQHIANFMGRNEGEIQNHLHMMGCKKFEEEKETTPITEHSGKKYLRKIRSALRDDNTTIQVDVYAVCAAFGVTDAPLAHAIKKLLCAGTRGKGDKIQDLSEAIDAISRAIDEERKTS